MTTSTGDVDRDGRLAPALLAAATVVAYLLTARDSYGIFRDELYYVACGRHLGFGYVDHPPLIGLVARFADAVLGGSQLALRVPPALAAGATVWLVDRLARELGGGRSAGLLAGLATALAPASLAVFGYLSMNAFDVLVWTALALIATRALRRDDGGGWIWFGAVAGIGLENKISVLFLGFGLAVGLVATWRTRTLRQPRLWLGGALALALFAPHLVWQAANGWPTLDFMENATRYKNLPLAPLGFLGGQLELLGPVAAVIAAAGLARLLAARDARHARPLGVAFLAVLAVFLVQRAKPYYLFPFHPTLLAAGGVALERLALRRGLGRVRPAAAVAIVATGLVLAPLAKPILPVERHVAYAARLGVAPSTSERKEVGRLPQFFADRLGWRELAAAVGEVYAGLPPEERAAACVFGQNYGQAGAIDYWRREIDLPPAISSHNSYHLWGPGTCSGEVLIVIGDDRETLLGLFDSVEEGATVECPDCMPYEAVRPIWVCRGPRVTFDELWPRLRNFS